MKGYMCLERRLPYSRENFCPLPSRRLHVPLIPEFQPTWEESGRGPFNLTPSHNHGVPLP